MPSFDDFKLNKQILQAVCNCGYAIPTPIQVKAIPLILNGHNVLGISQTGTGKTAAYVLPLLMKLKCTNNDNPRALILVPSKELAMQIAACIKNLSKYTDLQVVCLYGGLGTKAQLEQLNKGKDIVVSTPGALLNTHKANKISLRSIKTFILDEADKMFDMGFWPQIKNILELLPCKKQNLLFSATMSKNVLVMTEDFLEFPEKAIISPQATAANTINQLIYYVPNISTKANLLIHILTNEIDFSKVIIFANTRYSATSVAKHLQRKNISNVGVLHANKCQNTRINTVNSFTNGNLKILVTTDVFSRGIDIDCISHVINFEVPLVYSEYVHRIGRTGRANNAGCSITLCTEAEKYHIKNIEKLISQKIDVLPFPNIVEVVESSAEEKKATARLLDFQRQKIDPTYKGAFHRKKITPR